MIKQKPIFESSKSSRFQVIWRDETGIYNPSNHTGYGGSNGSPYTSFKRYIVDLFNTNTLKHYRKIIPNNPFSNMEELVNKWDQQITPQPDKEFEDGVYNLGMTVEMDIEILGEGFVNSDVVLNVAGAKALAAKYTSLVAGDSVYQITGASDSTLFLDRKITTTFNKFRPALKQDTPFVLYDSLKDCIVTRLSSAFSCCDGIKYSCSDELLYLQTLHFALQTSINEKDFPQANEYVNLMYEICSNKKGCKTC